MDGMRYNPDINRNGDGGGAENTIRRLTTITKGTREMATSDSTPSAFNSQSTYVYFIAAGSTPIKIGVSNDPAARLRDLQTAHYQKLHLLYTIECADRVQAFELETAFHRWYDDAKIRNEWFRINPRKIADDLGLLSRLAQAIVSVSQHVTVEQIEYMESRAETKISDNASSHDNVLRPIRSGTAYVCPKCGKEMTRQGWSGHPCRFSEATFSQFSVNGNRKDDN